MLSVNVLVWGIVDIQVTPEHIWMFEVTERNKVPIRAWSEQAPISGDYTIKVNDRI